MIRRKASVVTQKPAGTRTPSIRDSPPRCAPLPPTTATCISSTSCRPNTYCSIIAIPPRQPCSVALHWPVESPASRALSNLLLGTSSSLVAFPLRSRPAAPPSRAARTPAPPVPPAVRRHRVPPTSTTTHARRAPMSSSVLGPADDSAARPGSCRKPPSPLYVKSGKERDLLALPFGRPLRTDTLLVKRRRAAYGGTRRWPRRMSHRPTGAAAAREVLLFVGKARTSSSAPPFARTSSRNASAGRRRHLPGRDPCAWRIIVATAWGRDDRRREIQGQAGEPFSVWLVRRRSAGGRRAGIVWPSCLGRGGCTPGLDLPGDSAGGDPACCKPGARRPGGGSGRCGVRLRGRHHRCAGAARAGDMGPRPDGRGVCHHGGACQRPSGDHVGSVTH